MNTSTKNLHRNNIPMSRSAAVQAVHCSVLKNVRIYHREMNNYSLWQTRDALRTIYIMYINNSMYYLIAFARVYYTHLATVDPDRSVAVAGLQGLMCSVV